ncbi:GNAT family N-acetyltransferase [Halovenus sp. HT40]|uniref:GNAT family N-acetyltransferase n=1 Tax=Halovenus sp. HT40 TaxID=3126691 RepID=UPI00300EBF81
MQVREATPSQHAELLSILDAAALQTDSEQTRAAIERGDVFVALPDRDSDGNRRDAGSPPVLGALVLDGQKITAVAVRPGRRGQGIGRALVARAQQSSQRLVAEFDPGVAPFWEAVGFEASEQSGAERLSGVWRER